MRRDQTKRIEIEGVHAEDLVELVSMAVESATGPLRVEIEHLREELRKNGRRAVSHRAAPAYFDNAITPERILDYIHGRNLPQGAPGPLRARKSGQQWFIEVKDIESWQLGLQPE